MYLPPKYKYKQNRFGKADNCRTEHLHHNQLVFPCNKQTAVQYFCYLVRQRFSEQFRNHKTEDEELVRSGYSLVFQKLTLCLKVCLVCKYDDEKKFGEIGKRPVEQTIIRWCEQDFQSPFQF